MYDLDAETDTHTSHKRECRKIPSGDTGRYIRRLVVTERDDTGFWTFSLAMKDGVSQGGLQGPRRTIHRLLQVNAFNLGLGITNNAELKQYLGGKTIEEAFPYTCRDNRAYLRKLESKGWTEVEFAQWCDVDHLVGRWENWMNCNIFTMPCSHRYNRCLSAVRVMVGHWCFAFGYKAYNGGN